MCLILVSNPTKGDFKFILASNRDEFYKRKTSNMFWWSDINGLLAGQDLEQRGTWLGISNKGKFAAPVVDLQSQSLLVYENIINNVTTNEHLSEQGSASSKYVSRVVTLADGLDAEDIKVFVNAYKPANTDIKVYAKILNETDSLSVADTNWSQLQATQNKDTFSSEKERKDIVEYGFEFADTLETTAVDTVANGATSSTTINLSLIHI